MCDHGTIDREQTQKQETAALAGNRSLILTAQIIQQHGSVYFVVHSFFFILFSSF